MDERTRETVATYERVADRYAELHDDRSVVAELVTSFLDVLEGERVLDVGCGPGWETATFASEGLDPVGVDVTRAFLRDARDRAPDAAFFRGDMRSLPFTDGQFDGVWACASVLHLPREEARTALGEFARVLRDGGVVTVSMKRSGADEPSSPYEDDRRHFERYEPDELTALFEDAGFEVIDREASDRWIGLSSRTR